MPVVFKAKIKSARNKIEKYFKKHDMKFKECEVIVDKDLEKEYIIKRGYPNHIVVNRENISESKLAYYIINSAQNKLVTPINIKYLYSLLTEGLSDYVTNEIYSGYDIINPLGCELVKALMLDNEEDDVIKSLLKLDSIKIENETVDKLLNSEKVNENFKRLIKPRLDMVKRSFQVTNELDSERPNYLPFGEEFKAWFFITNPKFNSNWDNIGKLIDKYYEG